MNTSQNLFSRKYFHNSFIIAVLLFLLIITAVAAVLLGSTKLNIADAFIAALNNDTADVSYRILFHIRLPRIVAAICAGAALSTSGVIIQAVLNNPMASPNIIGVNSGAGLSVILFTALSPTAYSLLPAAAFAGAFIACLIICAIASVTDAGKITITLVGIAIGSILSAGISAVKTVFPDSMYDSNTFMIGGLSGVTYSKIAIPSVIVLFSLILAFIFSKDIDILTLGETTAKTLGMRVNVTRFLLIIVACLLAGCAVSFAGLISFVGLIVPHICKKLVGSKHIFLIPTAAIGGALLVLLCDILARVMFAPYEIPVGIILSFIGGPFFIFLILFDRKKKLYDRT